MKIFRLTILAVILLALLFVSSAMGGTEKEFLSSGSQNEMCLSFRNRTTMTGCCNASDKYQIINTTLTSPNQGIIHSYDGQRLLCFDKNKKRFKIFKRSKLRKIKLSQCHKKRHKKIPCSFTEKDQAILLDLKGRYQCVLHQEQNHSGFTYISVTSTRATEEKMYLAVRGKKVRKVDDSRLSDKHRRFIRLTESTLRGIEYKHCS